jgi:SsrA-binding protein
VTKPAPGKPAKDEIKVLARNKKAFHDYQISDRYEAGLSLVGSEVKSLREARCTLTDGFVEIRGGEAWLVGVQINEYPWANQFNHEPRRRRKLLLHKSEIRKLGVKTEQRGFTIVPLAIYLKNGKIKAELALATGKRHYEKREATKEADARREMDQASKRRR